MANDLTWQQLSDALPAGSITYDATAGIRIHPSVLTGDAYNGLTATGVIEAIAKLLNGCAKAQATINASSAIGSRLNAFAQPAIGVPTADSNNNYFATVTYTLQTRNPLDLNTVLGPQI
jgi:hypothetical protein